MKVCQFNWRWNVLIMSVFHNVPFVPREKMERFFVNKHPGLAFYGSLRGVRDSAASPASPPSDCKY